MNEIAANTNNVTAIQSNAMTGDIDAQQMMFDPQTYQYMFSIADAMSKGMCTIPKHLKGNIGDCMAIVMQAAQWNMNPWAVAQKTSEIHGKLLYEGQLVTAVINARLPMHGRLQFQHSGNWENVFGKFIVKPGKEGKKYIAPNWNPEDEEGLSVKVIGHIKGEDTPRVVEVLLTQCHPRNSTYWASNPKQQICYLASRIWARLNCPDVIMGVYCEDEFEPEQQQQPKEKDITPPKPVAEPQDAASRLIGKLQQGQKPEISQKQAEIDLNNILVAIDSSTELSELDEIVGAAANLPEELKAQARQAYGIKKKELKNN